MRQEMTNNELRMLKDSMDEVCGNPALLMLNKTKIQNFYRQNKMLLQILSSRMREIKLKYCIVDEVGEPVLDEKKELQYETEENKKKATEELTEFLNRSVTIEI